MENENVQKEFVNRCFFSIAENIAIQLQDLPTQSKKVFYLLVMRVFSYMSDKQQKNLIKLFLRTEETSEFKGFFNFLQLKQNEIKKGSLDIQDKMIKELNLFYQSKANVEPPYNLTAQVFVNQAQNLENIVNIAKSNQSIYIT